jgi:hypothetical protein
MRNVHVPKLVASGNQVNDAIQSVRTDVRVGQIRYGIVYEYISNRSFLSMEMVSVLEANGLNRRVYENAPPNSLIVKPIESGQAHFSNTLVVCLPINPFDINPIKVGEVVLFFSPVSELSSTDSCYWISRISLGDTAEDLNYAHFSRQYTDIEDTSFPNGTRSDSGEMLPGGENAFDFLYSVSESKRNLKNEAVPRVVNDVSGFFKSGSNRQLVCGGTFKGIPYCEISITRSATSRINDRDLIESNPAGRRDLFLSQNSPLLSPKISVYESPPVEGFNIGASNVNDENLGEHIINFSGNCAFISANSTIINSSNCINFKTSNSRISLAGNSLLIDTRNMIFKCQSLVVGSGNDLRFRIGGLKADQNMVLGKRLEEWMERLFGELESFASDVANANIPSPVGLL